MRYTPLFSVESWTTQYFGYTEFARTRENYAKDQFGRHYHEGIDLRPIDRSSWDLFTPIDGRVMWAGWGDTYGWNIIIHNELMGLSFRYCHLDKMFVGSGDILRHGDKIGVGGDSGKTEGRHLHLNMIPMTNYGTKDFPNNGTGGRENPLGALRALMVHI